MTTDCLACGSEGNVGGAGRLGSPKGGGGTNPGGSGGGGSKFKGGRMGGAGKLPEKGWLRLFKRFKLYKLGGGGKYPLLRFVLLIPRLVDEISWEGVDNGLLFRLSIYFFDRISEPRSSSKNKFRNFWALNSFDPKYGGSLAFLKMACERESSDMETASTYFSSSLIYRFFRLIFKAYLKISILDLASTGASSFFEV